MNKIILLFFVFLNFTLILNAQENTPGWVKHLKAINPTSDNKSLVNPQKMAIDVTGNLYSLVYMENPATLEVDGEEVKVDSIGPTDTYIIKSDPAGTLLWVKQIHVGAGMINLDPAGNMYLIGSFRDTVDFDHGPEVHILNAKPGVMSLFLLKLNANGDFQWVRQFEKGENGYLAIVSSALDASGNILLSGEYSRAIDFDPGPDVQELISGSTSSAFIVKLNSSGEFSWVAEFKPEKSWHYSRVYGVTADNDGNIYATGVFGGNNDSGIVDLDPGPGEHKLTSSQADPFIVKLDASGKFMWAKQFITYAGWGSSIVTDLEGNIYSSGNSIGGSLEIPSDTGNVIKTGGTYYLLKLNRDGNYLWSKHSSFQTGFETLYYDNRNSLYVGGSYLMDGTFDLEGGNVELKVSGEQTGFFARYDTSGAFSWVRTINGSNTNWVTTLVADNDNNVYTTGSFYGNAVFDTGTSNVELTALGDFDSFIYKMAQPTVSVVSEVQLEAVTGFPNPSSGIYSIDIPFHGYSGEMNITIYNAIGEKVLEYLSAAKPKVTLDISGFPTGVYTVRIQSGAEVVTSRVNLVK